MRWRRPPDIAFVESDSFDRVAVLSLRELSGFPVLLTGTACAVWALLEHPKTVDELVAELLHLFRGDSDDVRADLFSFLYAMRDANLLESEPSAGAESC